MSPTVAQKEGLLWAMRYQQNTYSPHPLLKSSLSAGGRSQRWNCRQWLDSGKAAIHRNGRNMCWRGWEVQQQGSDLAMGLQFRWWWFQAYMHEDGKGLWTCDAGDQRRVNQIKMKEMVQMDESIAWMPRWVHEMQVTTGLWCALGAVPWW